jgi:hypothetical protein
MLRHKQIVAALGRRERRTLQAVARDWADGGGAGGEQEAAAVEALAAAMAGEAEGGGGGGGGAEAAAAAAGDALAAALGAAGAPSAGGGGARGFLGVEERELEAMAGKAGCSVGELRQLLGLYCLLCLSQARLARGAAAQSGGGRA